MDLAFYYCNENEPVLALTGEWRPYHPFFGCVSLAIILANWTPPQKIASKDGAAGYLISASKSLWLLTLLRKKLHSKQSWAFKPVEQLLSPQSVRNFSMSHLFFCVCWSYQNAYTPGKDDLFSLHWPTLWKRKSHFKTAEQKKGNSFVSLFTLCVCHWTVTSTSRTMSILFIHLFSGSETHRRHYQMLQKPFSGNQAHWESWRTQVYYASGLRGVNTPSSRPRTKGLQSLYIDLW